MSEHISDNEFDRFKSDLQRSTTGEYVTTAAVLNDLSARLRALEAENAELRTAIAALNPKPLEYTSGSVAVKTPADWKLQQ